MVKPQVTPLRGIYPGSCSHKFLTKSLRLRTESCELHVVSSDVAAHSLIRWTNSQRVFFHSLHEKRVWCLYFVRGSRIIGGCEYLPGHNEVYILRFKDLCERITDELSNWRKCLLDVMVNFGNAQGIGQVKVYAFDYETRKAVRDAGFSFNPKTTLYIKSTESLKDRTLVRC